MTPEEKKIASLIKDELIDSLIPEAFKNKQVNHTLFGHCHHASLALYNLLGGKEKGYMLQKAIDELGIIHYWLLNNDNEIIDITSEQYTDLGRPLPYKNKKDNRASYRYTNSTKIIINNVKSKL